PLLLRVRLLGGLLRRLLGFRRRLLCLRRGLLAFGLLWSRLLRGGLLRGRLLGLCRRLRRLGALCSSSRLLCRRFLCRGRNDGAGDDHDFRHDRLLRRPAAAAAWRVQAASEQVGLFLLAAGLTGVDELRRLFVVIIGLLGAVPQ